MSEDIVQPPVNPLLEKVRIPGETFRLPSGGTLYKDGELASSVKNGEVHVYPLTALDEIVLKTPDKLLNGDAIQEVFSRCIPSILKPMRLFTKDVDYLMVCLRKVTFGADIELEYTHSCKDAKKHSYMFSINNYLQRAKTLEHIDPTSYNFTVGDGQKVVIKPLRFADYIRASQIDESKLSTPEQIRDSITASLIDVIESVDGTTERHFIAEWLNVIPSPWIHEISQYLDKASDWGVVFEAQMVCKDCEEEFTAATPINPLSFFS